MEGLKEEFITFTHFSSRGEWLVIVLLKSLDYSKPHHDGRSGSYISQKTEYLEGNPTLQIYLSSPGIVASLLSKEGLRENFTLHFSSQILPGFRIRQVEDFFIPRNRSMASGCIASFINRFFSNPMPCSPEIAPPYSSAAGRFRSPPFSSSPVVLRTYPYPSARWGADCRPRHARSLQ